MRLKKESVYLWSLNIYFVLYTFFTCTELFNPFAPGNPIQSKVTKAIIFITIAVQFVLWIFNKKRHTLIKNILFVIMFLLFLITLIFSIKILNSIPYLIFLFLFNANLVDRSKFVKFELFIELLLFIVIIAMYFGGLFPKENNLNFIGYGRVRYALGFNHPNVFGNYIFSFLSLVLIYFVDKIKNWQLYIIIILAFSLSIITDSRGTEVSILILFIGVLFKNIDFIRMFFIKYLSFILVVSIISFGIWSVYNYGNFKFLYKVNDLLSNRLRMQSYILNELYGPKMFGQATPHIYGISGLWIDNFYINTLISFGLFGMFLFICLIVSEWFFSYKRNDYIMLLILVAMLAEEFVESEFFNPVMIILLIYVFTNNFKINKISFKHLKFKRKNHLYIPGYD